MIPESVHGIVKSQNRIDTHVAQHSLNARLNGFSCFDHNVLEVDVEPSTGRRILDIYNILAIGMDEFVSIPSLIHATTFGNCKRIISGGFCECRMTVTYGVAIQGQQVETEVTTQGEYGPGVARPDQERLKKMTFSQRSSKSIPSLLTLLSGSVGSKVDIVLGLGRSQDSH